MPRLTEKQKRERARDRGEAVFEPMNGATVKAMFNLIRNLFGNPRNLGSATNPFTDEYDWKQLQATATPYDYIQLLKELAKTDERAYNKLYKEDPTTEITFGEYKKANPPSPAKIAELKAKYNPDIYLITSDERKYVTGQHSEARRLEDKAFREKSEAYFKTLSSTGPPSEAIALSTSSATQSAGGEPPRAQPRSTVSSRGRGRGGSTVSGLSHADFEAKKAQEKAEAEAKRQQALPEDFKDMVAKAKASLLAGNTEKLYGGSREAGAQREARHQIEVEKAQALRAIPHEVRKAQLDAEKAEKQKELSSYAPVIEERLKDIKDSIARGIEAFGPESDMAKQGEYGRFSANDYMRKDVVPKQLLVAEVEKAQQRGDILGQIHLLNEFKEKYSGNLQGQSWINKGLPELKR